MIDELLQTFQKQKQWTFNDLKGHFQCHSSSDLKELIKALNYLEEERLICNNHNVYFLLDDSYLIGKVKDVSKWEFAVINRDKKVYVPKKYARNVFDKDEVLVHMSKKRNEVVHIYSRGIVWITGSFYWRKNRFIFYSDSDLHTQFKITNLKDFKIVHRMKALLRVEKYESPLVCRIEKILGYEFEKGMDITSILSQNNVRQFFTEKVMDAANRMPQSVQKQDESGREDLRNLMTVTIDGDDAKDFDDAISIEKTELGYRLYVHIADVSYYVRPQSPIDQEAFARSTSIYVADRVVPMLPFALSNGICSLNPDVDRCTISCIMNIDEQGKCVDHRIVPSLIHSNHRCTYAKVNAFLQKDPQVCKEYEDIKDLLQTFSKCALLLQKQSKKRGTIDFNTKEAQLILDKSGRCVDVQCKERGFAQDMIEEAMILANVCVAHTLNTQGIPGIYRVHEKPDPEKVSQLMLLAQSLGITTSFYPEDLTAKQLQIFLNSIKDPDLLEILSNQALRTMQKARYDATCLGHFGLALKEYCHFTSPIRRYPDLVVHRMLRKYLFDHDPQDRSNDVKKAQKQAFYISEKEKEAVNTERQVTDCKRAEYMEDKIGQRFIGKVISVQSFGFFVELENTVEGLVPLHTLTDDYYEFDERAFCLKGTRSDTRYHMGQTVEVLCVGADKIKGQVTFALA